MKSILDIKNLSIAFGGENPVVKKLNLTLEAGKTLAIVGESGSGKSVSSLAILGLLPKQANVTANQMQFNGKDILSFSEGDFRNMRGKEITMIFQEPMTSLNPAMKCGKQVSEALILHDKISPEAAKK